MEFGKKRHIYLIFQASLLVEKSVRNLLKKICRFLDVDNVKTCGKITQ